MFQQTISKNIKIKGKALFSGEKVQMKIMPAPVFKGIVFIVDGKEIPAKFDNIYNTSRRTIIGSGKIKINTIEHLMAAFYFTGVSNAYIEMDKTEPPIMDGSAKYFVEKIQKAGLTKQSQELKPIQIKEKITFELPSRDTFITALPYDGFKITYIIDYKNCNSIKNEEFSIDMPFGCDDHSEISSARTFCLASELLNLKKNNVLNGADENNGVVYIDDDFNEKNKLELAKFYNFEEIFFNNKSVSNTELRFSNEAVRHKILDLIGDLYLLGRPVYGHIIAHKSGHKENIELTKKIAKELKLNHNKNIYKFDINDILDILHHRYPFLLIDEIVELVPNESVVAIKNVTYNEPYFQGHFPGKAIMPGVLILEAMAQSGGFLLLHTVKDPKKQLVIFSRINYAKFKKKVVPGNKVEFRTNMLTFKMNTCKLKSEAFVNDEIVAEAEFMTTITDKDF